MTAPADTKRLYSVRVTITTIVELPDHFPKRIPGFVEAAARLGVVIRASQLNEITSLADLDAFAAEQGDDPQRWRRMAPLSFDNHREPGTPCESILWRKP
ncbi:MAG: hypothetical protein WC969_15350 [Elusimicrobiota bacterium]|jgi:hypothetical protein